MQDKTPSCKVKNSKIWQTLILQNCLPLGQQARFTSKNVTQYLLGSRNNYNLFKFNEIKHLLLKFTPLIETLFRSKLVLNAKVGVVKKTRLVNPTPPKDPAAYQAWYEKMKNVKVTQHFNQYYYKTVENKRPIKILFASTNPTYQEIIKKSAEICQMSAHTNRWLCGYITANSTPVVKKTNVFFVEKQFLKTFHENKASKENFYKWHRLNELSHRPAIAIIPDIKNNDMILRETFAKDIPVIGLINSDDSVKIAYPIFGNSDSIQVTHFFCNFLAVLIAKAFVQQEYKQNSHRIINRTRAYFAMKNKQLKESNVYPQSKAEITNKYTLVPESPAKTIDKNIFKNLSKFAKFKIQKKLNKENKKRIVGAKPYWKNLKMMVIALRLSTFNSNNYENNDNILVKNVGKVISVRNKLRNLRNKKATNNILITKYIQKLNNLTSTAALKKALNKSNRKNLKKFVPALKNAYKLQEKHMKSEITPNFQMFTFNKLQFKQKKFKKRKLFVKAFGHKKLTRKKSRTSLQLKTKKWNGKKKPIKITLKLNSTLRRLQNLKYTLKNNPTELEKVEQIYNRLLVHKKKSAAWNTIKSTRLILSRISKNKKLFSVMLKKYPYLTLATKSVTNKTYIGLKKHTPAILWNGLNNSKKNPYAFSMKNFRRSRTIANNIIWDKLYTKQWIFKANKKLFKEKIYNAWAKSQIMSRGPIKVESKNKIYDFRRLVYFKNRKAVPKFITKIKTSSRNTFRKIEKRKYKNIWYNVWYKNMFALKYRRACRVIPRIVNMYKKDMSKAKFVPRHIILAKREAEKAKYKQDKFEKWQKKMDLLELEAKTNKNNRKK